MEGGRRVAGAWRRELVEQAVERRPARVIGEPALGRRIRHHTVRRRPSGAKELGEDRLLGAKQTPAVLRMRAALVRKEETSAGDSGARTNLESALDVGALSDPAGEKQREAGWQSRLDPLEELQGRHASAHVAAGLDPLDDHSVGSGAVGCPRLVDRAALMHPDTVRPTLRGAPEGDDDVGARGGLEPVATREGKQHVDRDRPLGQSSRGGELPLDRSGTVDRDRPQPTGFRDNRSELVTAQPTPHPRLHDRPLQTNSLEDFHATDPKPRLPGRGTSGCAKMPPVAESFKLVVLASGTGSNLQAILDRAHMRDGVEVVGVGSDKPGAPALERARAASISVGVFPTDDFPDREARDAAMGDWIEQLGADLIVLAGYMQLLSAPFVARFRHRIVNVHPALLPAFPGLDAIGQALAAGVEVTGVTVHFVDEGIDTGPAILQREVSVPPDRDREALELAIHATEHELYPEAIRMIAAGRVRIDADDPRLVVIDE